MPRHPTIIRRMIQSRLRRFDDVEQVLAATLVETRLRCTRPQCRLCAEGRGHPTRFVTFSRKGKTVTVYVPKDDLEEVRQWVREHRRVKRLVREISELSVELLRAEARIRRDKKKRRKKEGRRPRG
jgi:hypothetical protein